MSEYMIIRRTTKSNRSVERYEVTRRGEASYLEDFLVKNFFGDARAARAAAVDYKQALEGDGIAKCHDCDCTGKVERWCDVANGIGEHTTEHWNENCKRCHGLGYRDLKYE